MSRTRTSLATIGLTVFALTGMIVGPSPAFATPASAACAPPPYVSHQQDLNGDGQPDLVVGVPGASGGGAVDVRYGCSALPAHRLQEIDFDGGPIAAAGDAFGASTSMTVIFNQQTRNSEGLLAIGIPGVAGARGQVIVAGTSSSGVNTNTFVRINGEAAGDRFGAATVAYGDTLWVSAPGRSVDGAAGAGMVYHYRLDATSATLVGRYSEDTPGIPGGAEAGDHFGQVLAGADIATTANEVVIGEPDEDVGRQVDAGTVTILDTDPQSDALLSAHTLSQDSPGITGTPEAGDHFGASLSELADLGYAIGVPGEDLGPIQDAGAVHLLAGDGTTQVAFLTQESATVPGGSEAGDAFGSTVLLGGFDPYAYHRCNLDSCFVSGDEELAIGVPGEDLGSVRDAGDVLLLDVKTPTDIRYFGPALRRSGALGGTEHAGDRIGATLSALALPPGYWGTGLSGGDRLVIPLPAATVAGHTAAGAVLVRTFGQDVVTYTDSAGPVAGERYGVGSTATGSVLIGPSDDP